MSEIRLRQTGRRINAILRLMTLAGPLAKASASCNGEMLAYTITYWQWVTHSDTYTHTYMHIYTLISNKIQHHYNYHKIITINYVPYTYKFSRHVIFTVLQSTGNLQNFHPQNFIGKKIGLHRAGRTWMARLTLASNDGRFQPYQLHWFCL